MSSQVAVGKKRCLEIVDPDSDSSQKPQNRKRFLRFLKSHERKFGLTPVARDKITGQVTLVVCRFCQFFGREERPEKQRRSKKSVKYFRYSFRTDQYQQHHELSHCETWRRYQACSDDEKETFFSSCSGVSEDFHGIGLLDDQIEVGSNEEWISKPSSNDMQRRFDILPAIVELVAVLATGHAEPSTTHEFETQSSEIVYNVLLWCPPRDTFQSCNLVGTEGGLMYRVVVHSRSQIDCLVKLAAAGLSCRQISSMMRSFRFHAPVFFRDVISLECVSCTEVCLDYSEDQTAAYVRLIIAASFNAISKLLHGCWAFSLVLRACMDHAPIRSYLEFRVKIYTGGALYNIHLVTIPSFENACESMMFETLEQVLNVILPNWKQRLIGIATDGDAQLPARVLAIAARLQQEASASVVFSTSSACHQLDCIVFNFYSSLQGGCFLMVLKELSAYIRRQPELLEKISPPPPSWSASRSSLTSKSKWIALGNEVEWIATHRALLTQHLEAKNPPSAPDCSWWLFFAVVNWVATRANKTFERLLRNRTTLAEQSRDIAAFSNECATAFHALGPLHDPLLSPMNHNMFKSRNEVFALSTRNIVAFIRENDEHSIRILNTADAPIVDLAAENLALCGVNMIESLLELSRAVKNEQSQKLTECGPRTLTVTDLMPPTLPHEFAQLSERDLTSLLETFGSTTRTFFREKGITRLKEEFQNLRQEAKSETALQAALARCNADTPFKEAWASTASRFKHLECFAGGFASVFPCDSIATHGSTNALALCRNEVENTHNLLTDFAVEGSLHAQQFQSLMALSDKINEFAHENVNCRVIPSHNRPNDFE